MTGQDAKDALHEFKLEVEKRFSRVEKMLLLLGLMTAPRFVGSVGELLTASAKAAGFH